MTLPCVDSTLCCVYDNERLTSAAAAPVSTRRPIMSAMSTRALMMSAALLLIFIAITSGQNYCGLCQNHTMCDYKGVSGACRKGRWEHGVPGDQQKVIVAEHNRLRALVASGQEKRGNPGPQPAASSMLDLIWNNELAQVAQRWADQCDYKHDTCRNVDRFYVGQNLYIKTQWPCSSVNSNQEWSEAILSWYDEVAQFDSRTVGRYTFSSAVGHYTQVVWAKTKTVGCGYSLFQNGDKCSKYYVCNYGPGGNILGQPIYQTN